MPLVSSSSVQLKNSLKLFSPESGSCQVIINEQVRRKIKPGDSFGELALLYNAPRSASIKTLEDCSFWAVDRVSFRNTIEELTNNSYQENRKFIEDIKFFKNLTEDQKDGIAGVLSTQKFAKDQNVVSEGDPGSSYYIIKAVGFVLGLNLIMSF